MSFARVHKLIAYASAGLGLIALSLGSFLELLPTALMAVLFVASFFAEGERIQRRAWSQGWTVAVIVFLGLQVLRGLMGGSILGLTLEFAAALQLSRLFNRRSAREYQQIGALSLLHLIVGTVLSTELSYGLLFLAFVIVTPWILTLGHLRAEIEDQHAALQAAGVERGVPRVLASKRLVGPRFFAGTALLSLPLFAMTGVLFLMFPRVGLGFLSFDRGFGQRVSGFGGDVELGDFGVIRQDPTVVLRVVPPDLPESPPMIRSIRMRGTSFDRYDGRRWSRSRDAMSESVGHMESSYPVPVRFHYPSRDARWEVILDPLEEPVMFIPPDTVGLEIPPRMAGGLPSYRDVEIALGTDIRYADADGLGLRYYAWTSDRPEDRVTAPLDPVARARYVAVPAGHERVAELARRWTEEADSDEGRIQRIGRELARFEYSLETPALDGRLPLDVFLFEARRGHCEYFSTAMAVMLRTLDIPARNVTGFLGGRYNAYGGYYELSQGDAHSWVEAYLPGRGWVPLDPTPPARDQIAPDPGRFHVIRQMLDAIRTRWAEDVVGYDLRRQVGLARGLRRWLRGGATRPESSPEEPGAATTSSSRSVPGVALIGGIALLLALAYGVLRWRRRTKPPPLDPAVREVVELYRLFDRTLARLGRPRPPSVSATERLAELEAARFRELDLAHAVTEQYLRGRYGGVSPDAAHLAELRARIRALAGRRDLFGADV